MSEQAVYCVIVFMYLEPLRQFLIRIDEFDYFIKDDVRLVLLCGCAVYFPVLVTVEIAVICSQNPIDE